MKEDPSCFLAIEESQLLSSLHTVATSCDPLKIQFIRRIILETSELEANSTELLGLSSLGLELLNCRE